MSANDRLVDLELLVAASNFEISVAAVVPHSEESISDVMRKRLKEDLLFEDRHAEVGLESFGLPG